MAARSARSDLHDLALEPAMAFEKFLEGKPHRSDGNALGIGDGLRLVAGIDTFVRL